LPWQNNEFLKKFLNENIIGILGTIIFHLILLIIFFSWQLTGTKKYHQPEIIIDFSEDQPPVDEKTNADQELEKWLNQQSRSNIGVNVADELSEQLSTERFEQELMEELYKDRPTEATHEYLEQLKQEIETRNSSEDGIIPKTASEKMKSGPKYSGPTNIVYNLPGRNHTYLPVPVYLCQGGATVKLNIAVDKYGNVTDVNVAATSTAEDECFKNAAVDAALKSKFNANETKENIQHGTITYQFVSQ